MLKLIINFFILTFQYLKINLLKFKNKLFEYNLAFLSLILHKALNIEIPEEPSRVFDVASGVFGLSIICLLSMINLLSTVFILHFKDKYNLELKFKDYPLILKYLKFYEKASYINVIWQTFFIVAILLALIILTYLIMQDILTN